ncbi:LytTR family DNA-binding domain-containing protein [Ruminococcaceae bacterium OttesenSCG-928-L11]|nr:LytTR family DNA-binding domain-containing protein [Ruminococcaceae bacterium OttesenSCG-928-L11]
MRIAICEDMPQDRDRLMAVLAQYGAANQLEFTVDCYDSGEALLAAYQPGRYQILFLDILMDGLSGMEAAAGIRKLDEEAAIILTTVSREFAVDSYLVNAAFYLVKPVEYESLTLAMERCRHLIQLYAATITAFKNKKPIRLRLRDIRYLESQRNDCVIHTGDGEVRVRTLLSTLEPELGGLPFLRCHRSFIVNLRWVQDMLEQDFVMKNGVRVPISRMYLAAVRDRFDHYLVEEARGKSGSGSFG